VRLSHLASGGPPEPSRTLSFGEPEATVQVRDLPPPRPLEILPRPRLDATPTVPLQGALPAEPEDHTASIPSAPPKEEPPAAVAVTAPAEQSVRREEPAPQQTVVPPPTEAEPAPAIRPALRAKRAARVRRAHSTRRAGVIMPTAQTG